MGKNRGVGHKVEADGPELWQRHQHSAMTLSGVRTKTVQKLTEELQTARKQHKGSCHLFATPLLLLRAVVYMLCVCV